MNLRNGVLYFPRQITYQSVPYLSDTWGELQAQMAIIWDFSDTLVMDSAGIAWLEQKQETWLPSNQPHIQHLSPELIHLWETFHYPGDMAEFALPPPSTLSRTALFWIERLGERYQRYGRYIGEFLMLTSDIFYWSGMAVLGRKQHRHNSIIQQSILIGVEALPIIALMSGLIGLILALQSATQLRQFGADIYIADLIGIAMVREMAPLMTAIMLAGRSASSFASEIATMVVTEEMDALKIMAIQPIRFIVVPKFLAISGVTPLLTIFSNAIGIIGGFLVAVFYLEIPPTAFAQELIQSIQIRDVLIGEFKSLIFAWIILVIGAYAGFKVSGGSEGVGQVTTQAVVASIFLIILADSLFSLFFYF